MRRGEYMYALRAQAVRRVAMPSARLPLMLRAGPRAPAGPATAVPPPSSPAANSPASAAAEVHRPHGALRRWRPLDWHGVATPSSNPSRVLWPGTPIQPATRQPLKRKRRMALHILSKIRFRHALWFCVGLLLSAELAAAMTPMWEARALGASAPHPRRRPTNRPASPTSAQPPTCWPPGRR